MAQVPHPQSGKDCVGLNVSVGVSPRQVKAWSTLMGQESWSWYARRMYLRIPLGANRVGGGPEDGLMPLRRPGNGKLLAFLSFLSEFCLPL